MSKRNGREYRKPETECGDDNHVIYEWKFTKPQQPQGETRQTFSLLLWFREYFSSRFSAVAVK